MLGDTVREFAAEALPFAQLALHAVAPHIGVAVAIGRRAVKLCEVLNADDGRAVLEVPLPVDIGLPVDLSIETELDDDLDTVGRPFAFHASLPDGLSGALDIDVRLGNRKSLGRSRTLMMMARRSSPASQAWTGQLARERAMQGRRGQHSCAVKTPARLALLKCNGWRSLQAPRRERTGPIPVARPKLSPAPSWRTLISPASRRTRSVILPRVFPVPWEPYRR
jgi:hypothetical protein